MKKFKKKKINNVFIHNKVNESIVKKMLYEYGKRPGDFGAFF